MAMNEEVRQIVAILDEEGFGARAAAAIVSIAPGRSTPKGASRAPVNSQ
ncbi:hypothetical protein [Mesorhizobium sp. B3-1-6]|nr:hypothetical protein [Mesorhizobium sp. B3-1-6]